ncbi:MAG: ABC transporter ATP-binding protein/permease [Deltaproteobacteria bacterium]|nr:ABC transporter ATP-binding protein/permease [Deltaproteobacteria bacterium]
MILIMAVLDTVGVASIMPFMAVLGNPDVVETNRWLALAYSHLDFSDPKSFLFFLGAVVFIALVVSIAFKALTQWVMARFTHMRNYSISCRLFEGYLNRPYAWFLNHHSADLGKSVLSEVQQVIGSVIMPAMQLLVHGSVAIFLIILLVLVDPVMALIVALILGGVYAFIYMTIRRYLSRIGTDRVLANKERFQVAQEALGGIKEVKVFGREDAFFRQFTGPSFRFARHQASNQIAGQMPRYLLEMVAFGGILLLTLYFFRVYGHFSKVLPLLALYAFAGYRLVPALQQVYGQLTRLRFGLPAMDILYRDFVEIKDNKVSMEDDDQPPLVLQTSIKLNNIHFTYPGAQAPVLKGISLDISVNSAIGLVGATGSGKTTTVDIILGLLSPQSGQLLIDDNAIFNNQQSLRSWQRAIGYVPQHIYLSDDTVAANVAFGIPSQEIDMQAVIRAATIAELHRFVTQQLPKGYETVVGERGVRLSGGERQRVGIARALYHNPPVLILDEATSSLDNVTEKYVIRAIKKMKGKRTIILIAHRLTTVRDCDTIVLLDHGEIKAQGPYDDLVAKNEQFRKMATGGGGEA